MYNLTSKVTIIAIPIFIFIFLSCMKHDVGITSPLTINYPAAFIVNGASNNLSVIKLSDNTVSETITLNGATFPHHVYLNPTNTKLAVAITNTDLSLGHGGHGGTTSGYKVQIIDVVSGAINKEISLAKLPHNAIFNKTGTELWIGQMDTIQSKVLIYKTSDWTLQNTINVGKGLSEVTFSEDGSFAYACNTIDGTVSIIDPSLKAIHHTLPVGQDPVGAWSASNGKMYVDNELSKTVSEISVIGLSVVSTINLGFKPGYVAYSDHHAELWISDATNGKVVYYKLVGSVWTVQGMITTGADAHAIAFASDGTKAYVTNQGAGTVSVIDLTSHSVSKTITVGTKPNGIALKM